MSNLRKVQFEYLEFLFKGMFSVKSKYYPNSTFFKKDDKVILELEKSGTLWVLYSVWTNISDMFSYDYGNTQQLIKEWMEQQIKSEEVAPSRASSMYGLRIAIVEEKLKSAEITPLQGCVSPFSMDGEELTPQQMNYVIIGEIEEESKSAEIEPISNKFVEFRNAERRLKLVEVTPKLKRQPLWYKVEAQLKQEEITPKNAIAPPFSWRKLDSVKYAEIKPRYRIHEEQFKFKEGLESEEITPRQVVSASFDWVQEQINLGEMTPTSFFVIK